MRTILLLDGTQIELNKINALKLCLEHWKLIAQTKFRKNEDGKYHIGKIKYKALYKLISKKEIIAHSCFCCEYAGSKGLTRACYKCPLINHWGDTLQYACEFVKGNPYRKFMKAKTIQELRVASAEMVSLIQTALSELEPKV